MNAAIIVAAGSGKRMGQGTDKLFLELGGLPVVGHTWQGMDESGCFGEIIVVIKAGREKEFQRLAEALSLTCSWRLVPGGRERQDSVWAGLEAVSSGCQVVAIQDGARPCTAPDLVRQCVAKAGKDGAAVAARPVTDTIKESDDGQVIDQHLDRSRLWAVQTPQCFQVEVIRQALAAVRDQQKVVTDDTAACALIGQRVHLVHHPAPNPKLTTTGDIPYLETLLASANRGEASGK